MMGVVDVRDRDLDDVEEYILAQWPGCRDGLSVRDWQRIGDGWECDTYGLVLLQGGRERALVLRLYPPHSEQSLELTSVDDEYRVMSLLHRDGFPSPRVYLWSSGASGNRPFILMDRHQGEQLGRLYRRADPGAREGLREQFCRLLVSLHSLDPRPYPGGENGDDSPVHTQVTKFEKYIQLTGLSDLEPGVQWLRRSSRRVHPGRRSVVHWDYHPENVLIAPDGRPCVIDWSSAEVTDSRFDVGNTLVFQAGVQLRGQFLAGYEELSGAPVGDLEFFAAAGCLRRLLVLLTILESGPERLGLRPGVRGLVESRAMGHLADVYRRFVHITGVDLPVAGRWIDRAGQGVGDPVSRDGPREGRNT